MAHNEAERTSVQVGVEGGLKREMNEQPGGYSLYIAGNPHDTAG